MKKVAFLLTVVLFLALFATAAQAQGDWSPTQHYYLNGKIVAINKTASTVTFTSKGTARTLQVNAETWIKKCGQEATLADLGLADKGLFKYSKTDTGQLEAIKIYVDTPFTRGKISKVGTDSVTLKHRVKTQVFKIKDTKIFRNWNQVTLSELRVGDHAKIYYNKLEAGGLVARKIKAEGRKVRHRWRQGKIIAIHADVGEITFLSNRKVKRRRKRLQITDDTWIKKNGRNATFAKLALADRGTVKYIKGKDNRLIALKVFVKTPFTTGRISGITSDTVTLKHRQKSRVFKISPTKIRRNGITIPLSELNVGDWAKIYYNRLEEGGLWARRIKAAGTK